MNSINSSQVSKNKYYLVVGIISLAVTTLAVSSLVSAGEGFGWKNFANLTEEQKAQLQEKKEEMKANFVEYTEAIENNDYDVWQALMQEKVELMHQEANDLESNINQETFAKIVEMHNLKAAGDIEGAKAIAEELGFMGPKFGHKGYYRGLK